MRLNQTEIIRSAEKSSGYLINVEIQSVWDENNPLHAARSGITPLTNIYYVYISMYNI